MAITSLDQLIAAPSQRLTFMKATTRTSVAGVPFSVFDIGGVPSAGTLAVGNTTSGIVPTSSTAGYPPIASFNGNTGYLVGVHYGSSVSCRMTIFDCLFSAGAFAFNASVALTGQPSYASRVPNGTDFKNTEIFLECVTAFTGSQSIAVTYTNQDGVTGRTTGTIATGAVPIVGRMLQLPLQAGDTGVQKIESVTSSVSTAGTFNVHVMRRLYSCRVRVNNDGGVHNFTDTGMPQVFETSALRVVLYTDSTATGIPEMQIEIATG